MNVTVAVVVPVAVATPTVGALGALFPQTFIFSPKPAIANCERLKPVPQ